MSQRRTKTTTPAGPKAGKGSRKPLDAVAFSEEDAAHLRQVRHFYKEFPAAEVDDETGELCVIPELQEVLTLALRFAATLNGAPARCRNQHCSKGRRHMRIESRDYGICEDGVCGGGISQRTMDDAAKMLGFLIEFGKRYAPWAWA